MGHFLWAEKNVGREVAVSRGSEQSDGVVFVHGVILGELAQKVQE